MKVQLWVQHQSWSQHSSFLLTNHDGNLKPLCVVVSSVTRVLVLYPSRINHITSNGILHASWFGQPSIHANHNPYSTPWVLLVITIKAPETISWCSKRVSIGEMQRGEIKLARNILLPEKRRTWFLPDAIHKIAQRTGPWNQKIDFYTCQVWKRSETWRCQGQLVTGPS